MDGWDGIVDEAVATTTDVGHSYLIVMIIDREYQKVSASQGSILYSMIYRSVEYDHQPSELFRPIPALRLGSNA